MKKYLVLMIVSTSCFVMGCASNQVHIDGSNENGELTDDPLVNKVSGDLSGTPLIEGEVRDVISYRVIKVQGDADEALIVLPNEKLPDDERFPMLEEGMVLPKGTEIDTGYGIHIILSEFLKDDVRGALVSLRGPAQLILDPTKYDVEGVRAVRQESKPHKSPTAHVD